MRLRNPLQSRSIVFFGVLLGACLGVLLGCDVYDDELLRLPDDEWSDAGQRDAVTTGDGAAIIVRPSSDAGDTSAHDVSAAEAAADREVGTTTDVSWSDRVPDWGGTRPDLDAATSDNRMRDARLTSDADATIGSRDADAASTPSDASDAGLGDAADADGTGGDGATAPPDGGSDADGGGAPTTFRVVRVGNGTTELSDESAAAFIEERGWDGQLAGPPLALPTTATGAQGPLTLSGIATSEGALALSLDGRYLALTGYATSPGRPSVAASNNVDRIVARVDAAGVIDTSTRLGDAFSGSNVRSAASTDGTGFWVAGSSGGVWYAARGGTGLAQIVSLPDNVRVAALFGDRLYACSGTSPMTNVFTVGNSRPIAGVQNVAALAGMPRTGQSPYAFAFFDRNPTVGGLDTLYVADDRSPISDGTGGGIQKWIFDGSAWSRVATFTSVGAGTASFRGVAGVMTATGVTLVASTAEPSPNRLVVLVDDGSPAVTGAAVATAPSNTVFRGVALSPHF
jgi:hypothetical protein